MSPEKALSGSLKGATDRARRLRQLAFLGSGVLHCVDSRALLGEACLGSSRARKASAGERWGPPTANPAAHWAARGMTSRPRYNSARPYIPAFPDVSTGDGKEPGEGQVRPLPHGPGRPELGSRISAVMVSQHDSAKSGEVADTKLHSVQQPIRQDRGRPNRPVRARS
jgi:hypothetical protein